VTEPADHDASSRVPVDEADAVSGFQIGVVLIGISITLGFDFDHVPIESL
jgi:hypothetical protein